MDIRSSLEGLKSLLGTPATAPAATQQPKSGVAGATAGASGLGADRATLSSAGNEVSQTAGDSTVRMDKVAGIQAALAAGTYNVSAGAVASKVVDSMLAG
jgi:negative regulator of flagellin synthesis FlgM